MRLSTDHAQEGIIQDSSLSVILFGILRFFATRRRRRHHECLLAWVGKPTPVCFTVISHRR
jgi:hypothetical protein